MAKVPQHIVRWAPQDWRTSRPRMRSITTKDPWLRVVYFEALNALYEAGGEISADPQVLTDVLGCPPKEILRCLQILDQIARTPGCRGGLIIEDGKIRNRRTDEHLGRERSYKDRQSDLGKKGAEKRWGGKGSDGVDMGYPINSDSQPAPAPGAVAERPTAERTGAVAERPTAEAEPHPDDGRSAATETEREDLQRELARTARHVDRPADELLTEASITSRGKVIVSLHSPNLSGRWVRNTIQRLAEIRAVHDARRRDGNQQARASPQAVARQQAAEAMIRGGLRDGSGVDTGNGRVAGEPTGPGLDAGDAEGPRRKLPERTGPPER